jgi:hypothetical protein
MEKIAFDCSSILLENFVLSRVGVLAVSFARLVLLCHPLILILASSRLSSCRRTGRKLGDREIVQLAKALESNRTLSTLDLDGA